MNKNAQIKIGVSPLSWMNSDIPSLGGHIPPEQCLEDAGKIGYKGVELEDPFRKIMDKFPLLLKQHGLELVAGWHSTFLLEKTYNEELESLKRHMDVLHSLGSNTVNVAECSRAIHRETIPLSKRPILNSDEWKKLCEDLENLAQYMQKQGFISAYHHHMGTVVQSGQDIYTLMQGTNTLGLLFDTGHLRYAGENPLDILLRHVSRVTHVHCKNIRSSVLKKKIAEDSHFFSAIIDGAFTVPGDVSDRHESNAIDFAEVLSTLNHNGYGGWIVVEAEQDPKKADSFTYAKLGYETIARLLQDQQAYALG